MHRLLNSNPAKFKRGLVSYEPVKWSEYFDAKEDLVLPSGTFRVYRKGIEGPLLLFLHGGGFSALSWSELTKEITSQLVCQCLACDLRGHGDTKTKNDCDLSVKTLSNDIFALILSLYPSEAPPIIIIGHSLGGSVAVHMSHKRLLPSLVALVVIDVVEGSAMDALSSMKSLINNRPRSFRSLDYAIEWSVRSNHIRNPSSARVSFPGQLRRIGTNETATSELERGACFLTCHNTALPGNISRSIITPSSTTSHSTSSHDILLDNLDNCCDNVVLPVVVNDVILPLERHPQQPAEQYIWSIDLSKTEQYWEGWFAGLTEMFLNVPIPKLLLLAEVDRLDKNMTIGQMQGKFQMHVLTHAGHALHEDVPDKVAECLSNFLLRNRFAEYSSFEDADRHY